MKFSGLWLMLILIGGLIPIGTTFAQNQSTNEYLGEQNNEEIAGEIINQLTKLSTLVDIRVKPVKSRLPKNLLKDYDKAKELKKGSYRIPKWKLSPSNSIFSGCNEVLQGDSQGPRRK